MHVLGHMLGHVPTSLSPVSSLVPWAVPREPLPMGNMCWSHWVSGYLRGPPGGQLSLCFPFLSFGSSILAMVIEHLWGVSTVLGTWDPA